MHRASTGMPDRVFMRLGQVDDFSLHETAFRPTVELFVKDRVTWQHPVEDATQLKTTRMRDSSMIREGGGRL
jgi:hypothetical protein